MNRAALLLVALPLAGCGSGDDPAAPVAALVPDACSTEYHTTVTGIGETGLMLAPQEGAHISFAQMEDAYRSVQRCAGITAPGPWVMFRSFETIGRPRTYGGLYDDTQKAVWVNTDPMPGYPPRDCKADTTTLRHEFLHHLLASSTGDPDAAHASPLFVSCAQ